MSSKNGNREIRNLSSFLRSRSITGKLTLLYTVSSFGMLVLASTFLYQVLARDLDRESNQVITDRIFVLRAMLREFANEPEALEEEVRGKKTAPPFPGYYARILTQEGEILFETPRMGEILPASSFPTPGSEESDPGVGVKRRGRDGKPYLINSAWAETGDRDREKKLLHVAKDISYEGALIDNYRRKLLIVLFLGILFSAGFGATVARKGMSPLKEITRVTRRISATRLHERLDPAHWPQELSLLAATFNRMLSRLEDSFDRLSQFSADLAHELRTPINTLMGEAEVALSRKRTPEELRQVLESGLEEYGRLSRLIDSLLFLARAESMDIRIDRMDLDAREEMEAVREFYDAVAEERGVKVLCRGSGSVQGDSILFRRMIGNLLSNALQYTVAGGEVTLSLEQQPDQSILIRVSDTGIGIPPEHLPKIFNRFYRTDPSRSQYPQGVGLGLAMVKSIMELHGGSVEIQSEPGKGTTVTLVFPHSSVSSSAK